jgi:hypothetical protein
MHNRLESTVEESFQIGPGRRGDPAARAKFEVHCEEPPVGAKELNAHNEQPPALTVPGFVTDPA